MIRKVQTTTGLQTVIDRKVAVNGAFHDVHRRMQKQPDGTFRAIWERYTPPLPHPPPPQVDPADIPPVEPFRMTVNAHDGIFALPHHNGTHQNIGRYVIVDWGDGNVHATSVESYPSVAHGGHTSRVVHHYDEPGVYEIKIYPLSVEHAGSDAKGWLSIDFSGANFQTTDPRHAMGQLNRDKVIQVGGKLTPSMFASSFVRGSELIVEGRVGFSAGYRMFQHCRNITMADDFGFSDEWDAITYVDGRFCTEMFKGCSGDNFTMGKSFNLPRNIIGVFNGSFPLGVVDYPGSNFWFCTRMFEGCSGAAFNMNDIFNLPPNFGSDGRTAGRQFCYEMFRGCSGDAFTMNDIFNLPQGIISAGDDTNSADLFCTGMFQDCFGAAFTMNDVFQLPPNLVTPNSWFCQSMFRNCRGDAFNMNAIFNIPQGITRINAPDSNQLMGHFCEAMFRGCSGDAFTMNDVFQLPQGLRDGHLGSFVGMFLGCRGQAFNMNDIITLPQAMVQTNRGLGQAMFEDCTGESFTMNDAFCMPPNLEITDSSAFNLLAFTFAWCRGAAFQVNGKFRFPPNMSQSQIDRAFSNTFSGIQHRQNRTAASIINGNLAPTVRRNTFSPGFADWNQIHENWR